MLLELRLALRRLGKRPGLALTAILTLAIALGANTTIFSVAHAGLWRPLPTPDPEYLAFEEGSSSLEGLAAYVVSDMNARADDAPGGVAVAVLSERFVRLMMACFAGIALLLAVVGIHGAIGNSVQQRRHEFGVRLALGASPRALLRPARSWESWARCS